MSHVSRAECQSQRYCLMEPLGGDQNGIYLKRKRSLWLNFWGASGQTIGWESFGRIFYKNDKKI